MRQITGARAAVAGLGLVLGAVTPGAVTPGAVTLAALAAPAAAQQGDATGLWLTEGGKAKVRIAPCSSFPAVVSAAPDQLCGAIEWLAEPDTEAGTPKTDRNNPDERLRDRPILGLLMLTGFRPAEEPGSWDGGRIYNPEDGETYRSTMTLRDGGARLEVRGYVGLPVFGKSQLWTRSE